MRVLIILLIAFGIPIICIAQKATFRDTPESITKNLPDTSKAVSLNDLSNDLRKQGKFEEAIAAAQEALKWSEQLGQRNQTASAHINIGNVLMAQGKEAEVINGIRIIRPIILASDDHQQIGRYFTLLGMCYKSFGQYELAIDNYRLALNHFQKSPIGANGIASCYSNLGIIFSEQGDHEEGMQHYLKAARINEEQKNYDGMTGDLSRMAINYAMQKRNKEAIEYFNRGLEMALERGLINQVPGIYHNRARVLQSDGQLKAAEADFRKAISTAEQIGRQVPKARANMNLAECLIMQNRPKEASPYLEAGMEFSRASKLKDLLMYGYATSAKLDSALGNYPQALANHKLFFAYKDSLDKETHGKETMQIRTIYETEMKDQEIASLEKDKELQVKEISRQKLIRNGFIGGFGVILLFSMAIAFQSKRIAKEKKRSEDLLLNILPAEVAEELKSKGSADARLLDQVTVLFTDFKGFTALSEQLTPQELVAEINFCFSAFDRFMEKHGVEKIKTIGDAYMAAGGLPVPNQTHAVNVVSAALDIRDFMQQRCQERKNEGLPYFEIRIGVHTGPVVAGIVGIKKFQYDIWGDTVNTAARMESSGTEGKVNISSSTYALVKDGFDCAPRGMVTAKGKGDLAMYYVEPIIA